MQAFDYMQVANDPMLWIFVIPVISIVAIQAVLFIQRSRAAAEITSLTRQDLNRAFRVGLTSSIGPSISVFVVMVAMMGIVGTPITWQRLSMIGAANTELTCATLGAEAMKVEFGGPGYGITEFANSVWAMALNGCGWLVFCGLFTDKLGVLQEKVSGGNQELMMEIAGAAVLGTTSFLVANNTKSATGGIAADRIAAAIVAAVVMLVLERVAKKVPIVGEYSLGISMIVGMLVGVVVFNQMG